MFNYCRCERCGLPRHWYKITFAGGDSNPYMLDEDVFEHLQLKNVPAILFNRIAVMDESPDGVTIKGYENGQFVPLDAVCPLRQPARNLQIMKRLWHACKFKNLSLRQFFNNKDVLQTKTQCLLPNHCFRTLPLMKRQLRPTRKIGIFKRLTRDFNGSAKIVQKGILTPFWAGAPIQAGAPGRARGAPIRERGAPRGGAPIQAMGAPIRPLMDRPIPIPLEPQPNVRPRAPPRRRALLDIVLEEPLVLQEREPAPPGVDL
uniref:Uncharacterized protein n=1 Tax=Globodera rostochiensis TaxID=31243 RepID=A0A914IFV5_GLORO